MRLSVCIPTHGRPDLLDRCLRSLSEQAFEGFDAEVIVGIDGEDSGEVACAQRWSSGSLPMRALPAPHAGPASTRNRICREATGDTLLFLNDDIEAMAGLLQQHAEAQQQLAAQGRIAMVLGAAPWAVEAPDRVIDRLTRETSLIFFYDQMTGDRAQDPEHDWGWRHAWTLNLSLPASALREVGGYREGMTRPVYEDIEMAFRVRGRFGAPTLYRPRAQVLHRHRYEPVALLAREYVLGHQSRRLAEVSPACARELFRDDPMSPAVIESASDLASTGRGEAELDIARFLEQAREPSGSLDAQGLVSCFGLYKRCRACLRAMGLADAGAAQACDPPIRWLTELAATAAAH